MELGKIFNKSTVFNTNLSDLETGKFVVTDNGSIVPLDGIKMQMMKIFGQDKRDPKALGKLLHEKLGDDHPNTRRLVDLGFAILGINKEQTARDVKQAFDQAKLD